MVCRSSRRFGKISGVINSDLYLMKERPSVVLGSFVVRWMSCRYALVGILEGRPLLGRFATVPSFFFHLEMVVFTVGSQRL